MINSQAARVARLSVQVDRDAQLRQAGLVASTRGPGGGYKLARNASDITIADIARASEQGELRGVSGEHDSMSARQGAMTHERWRAFHQTVDDYLQSVSLANVVREHIAKGCIEEGLSPPAPVPERRPLHSKRQLPAGDVPNSVFALGRALRAR
jgi:Rrf2 family iron-sulfur cluster assembly transcriptional regulator